MMRLTETIPAIERGDDRTVREVFTVLVGPLRADQVDGTPEETMQAFEAACIALSADPTRLAQATLNHVMEANKVQRHLRAGSTFGDAASYAEKRKPFFLRKFADVLAA